MPFALTRTRYVMRLAPNGGAGSTVTAQWCCYDREFDEDTGKTSAPDEGTGRDYHVLFKFAVGPAEGDRRRARLSAWVGPTKEDCDNAKYVGMCIDENNEAELVRGSPTAFHMKVIRASDDDPSRTLVFPGMTIFVEWSALDMREVFFSPVVQDPIAYMQLLERYAEVLSSHQLESAMSWYTAEEQHLGPIPLRPTVRTKPPSASKKRLRNAVTAAEVDDTSQDQFNAPERDEDAVFARYRMRERDAASAGFTGNEKGAISLYWDFLQSNPAPLLPLGPDSDDSPVVEVHGVVSAQECIRNWAWIGQDTKLPFRLEAERLNPRHRPARLVAHQRDDV